MPGLYNFSCVLCVYVPKALKKGGREWKRGKNKNKTVQNKVAIAAGLIKLFLKYNLKYMTCRFDCAVVSKLTHCGFHLSLCFFFLK